MLGYMMAIHSKWRCYDRTMLIPWFSSTPNMAMYTNGFIENAVIYVIISIISHHTGPSI